MTALLLELSDDLYEPIKQQALKKHKKPEQIVIELLRQLFENSMMPLTRMPLPANSCLTRSAKASSANTSFLFFNASSCSMSARHGVRAAWTFSIMAAVLKIDVTSTRPCSFIKLQKLRVEGRQFLPDFFNFRGDIFFAGGQRRFAGKVIKPFAESKDGVELAELSFPS